MIVWYFKSMSNLEYQKKHMFMASLFLSKQNYFYVGIIFLAVQQISMELVIWFDRKFDSHILSVRLMNFSLVVLMLCLMVLKSLRRSYQLFKFTVALIMITRMSIKFYEIVACRSIENSGNFNYSM